jgi:hypothetical protein
MIQRIVRLERQQAKGLAEQEAKLEIVKLA